MSEVSRNIWRVTNELKERQNQKTKKPEVRKKLRLTNSPLISTLHSAKLAFYWFQKVDTKLVFTL